MELINNYKNALQALYNHVGFVEDWVVCPISNETDRYWSEDGSIVKYADSKDQFESDGDYYQDDIYTQRFYDQHVYSGDKYTMIFCDPHVDGMKWFRVFDNDKRMK